MSQMEGTAISSPKWGNQPSKLPNGGNPIDFRRPSAVFSGTSHSPSKAATFGIPKRSRSPPLLSPSDLPRSSFLTEASSIRLETHLDKHLQNGTAKYGKRMKSPRFESRQTFQSQGLAGKEAQMPELSALSRGNGRNPVKNTKAASLRSSPSNQLRADVPDSGYVSPPKPLQSTNSSKRARSPQPMSNKYLSTLSNEDDSEREMQAKLKRLARFNIELSQPSFNVHDQARNSSLRDRQKQATANTAERTNEAQALVTGCTLSDHQEPESGVVVVGLCPDMCPESEREERERKGDLDRFERWDGDRNQTSKFLAVKKYNRTAERDAELIRPMSVLQKTVKYLLNLLSRPYGDDFLNIYNFLWDRMRAIRMDLRMQHLFNEEAISMLEQMIRLHIIAMHELCEYKKGEGFSEGFDAHLNIEQMNKTSVELFQMYDDFRKKGRSLPTEKEFRGYYALLKLDRHPGYKVEPAELSLDLAKMAPRIRRTPEILLARDVARACRIGNYIAFFRLARKASYLQACLMHAHFAKLRRHALASLHSGLQNNQGIPAASVVSWLAMEGEDIEGLLEYYGFSIKKYEETYMVKEGPFLNSDMDFPTQCSQLVNSKKSRRIVDDVQHHVLPFVHEETESAIDMSYTTDQNSLYTGEGANVVEFDEEMIYEVETNHTRVSQAHQLIWEPSAAILNKPLPIIPDNKKNVDLHDVPVLISSSHPSFGSHVEQVVEDRNPQSDEDSFVDSVSSPRLRRSTSHGRSPRRSLSGSTKNLEPDKVVQETAQDEALIVNQQNDEANREKLKRIMRKWKLQASNLKALREERLWLANVAFSSLSLGLPILQSETQTRSDTGKFNIDFVAMERYGRQGMSCSRLNVAELVASILSARNPEAKCICWKLALCFSGNETQRQLYQSYIRWLQLKIMAKRNDDDLLVSSSGVSIWKKWIDTSASPLGVCCLSIIRELDSEQVQSQDSIAGASCILFVISETVPWEIQRAQLHDLLQMIPSGSGLPLLIVSCNKPMERNNDASVTIVHRLGLHDADKTRMKSFAIIFTTDNNNQEASDGFFSDKKLREGLQWLAENSPPQPSLHLVNTRELVLSYLKPSLDALDKLNISKVGPQTCIAAFNEALDKAAEEILSATSMNPNHWPGPEVDLLDKSSSEQIISSMFLPCIGWSSLTAIDPIIRAIKGCKLPEISDDISCLNQGSHIVNVESQKLILQECLIKYLSLSCDLLYKDIAEMEVNIMLQTGTRLELRGSSWHIVPRWVFIFRRIVNWQLTKLTSRSCQAAYISERNKEPSTVYNTSSIGKMDGTIKLLEDHTGFDYPCVPSSGADVSLDELVEVSYSVSISQRMPPCSYDHFSSAVRRNDNHVPPKEFVDPMNPSTMIGTGEINETDNFTNKEIDDNRRKFIGTDMIQKMAAVPKDQDRLSLLLEQCKCSQDKVDKILAIYN